jgi:predicted nucleotidyltransferase
MITTVIEPRKIFAFVDHAVEVTKPQKVILFGSYARGTPTADSDVDLLVVMSYRGSPSRIATKIRLTTNIHFPMDLIVRSAAQIQREVAEHNWFFVEVMEQGIILYDSANPGVGEKGRRRLGRRLASAAVT